MNILAIQKLLAASPKNLTEARIQKDQVLSLFLAGLGATVKSADVLAALGAEPRTLDQARHSIARARALLTQTAPAPAPAPAAPSANVPATASKNKDAELLASYMALSGAARSKFFEGNAQALFKAYRATQARCRAID